MKPRSGIGKNFKFEDIKTPGNRRVSSMTAKPLKEFNKSSSRLPQDSSFLDHQFDSVLPDKEQNGFTNRFQNTRSYTVRVPADKVTSPCSNFGLFKDSAQEPYIDVHPKRRSSDTPDRPWTVVPSDDIMDISWSHGEKDSPDEDINTNGGLRWRSDDTSEDEEQQSPDRHTGVASHTTPMKGVRKSRVRHTAASYFSWESIFVIWICVRPTL
ncbi:hypothetical protein F0562_012871 [Nyssa sinensis]|uniref:Uncharacterized protein n=1 Tax=Nyssa sinensis TaxID=561372 RepID=A0A5J4ZWX8_9ASTE|nr:hypothetical protein F0562_012871 [Nyssa sinensis]